MLFESVRFCAGRRYLSGDDFTGDASKGVNAKSGSCDDRLIIDPGLDPITESSFADGTDAVSDEDVDGDGMCVECLIPPFGAEDSRTSCRRFGVA